MEIKLLKCEQSKLLKLLVKNNLSSRLIGRHTAKRGGHHLPFIKLCRSSEYFDEKKNLLDFD